MGNTVEFCSLRMLLFLVGDFELPRDTESTEEQGALDLGFFRAKEFLKTWFLPFY